MAAIVAVYADGGMLGGRNPSSLGISWAWCAVDAQGARLAENSGCIEATDRPLSNNVAEFVAAVQALESLPHGWSGRLCLDSRLTLGRLCVEWWEGAAHHVAWELWPLTGLPVAWVDRGRRALGRLGHFTGVLVQGHPTRADLAAGIGARSGMSVSLHNVYVDALCRQQAVRYINRLGLARLAAQRRLAS